MLSFLTFYLRIAFVLLVLTPFVLFTGCKSEAPIQPEPEYLAPLYTHEVGQVIEGQYMVVFKNEENARTGSGKTLPSFNLPRPKEMEKETYWERERNMMDRASEILMANQIPAEKIRKVFTAGTAGITVELQPEELETLRTDNRIDFIEEDRVMALNVFPHIKTPMVPTQVGQGNQVTPYGIRLIGGSEDFSTHSQHHARWAWVIDSGIDLDHPDLKVNKSYSANFTSEPSAEDGHGHGTHVAGIIAAKDNELGVTGVAAGATVVAIKVLDSQGLGSYSSVVAALNYISNYLWPEDVINISLGGAPSPTLDAAIMQIASSGVKIVIAAGNSADNINNYSPGKNSASSPNIFGVSSIDHDKYSSYFSNYGNGVDFAAPGENIVSTHLNGQYASMTGTSMAAPHVAGVMILKPNNYADNPTGQVLLNNQHVNIIGH